MRHGLRDLQPTVPIVLLGLARTACGATGNAVAPLQFNQVSESIGVSAQQVSPNPMLVKANLISATDVPRSQVQSLCVRQD